MSTAIAVPASASTVSVTATEDTFVNNNTATGTVYANNNNGLSLSLFAGQEGHGGKMRILLRFKFSNALAGVIKVTAVKLTLTMRGIGSTGTGLMPKATLSIGDPPTPIGNPAQSWTEGIGAGNSQMLFVVGQACSSGASWNHPDCSAAATWNPATATAYGTTATVDNAATGTAVFSDTATNGPMVGAVQGWIDGGTNGGWIIWSSGEGTNGQLQRFYSKDDTSVPPPTITAPLLDVTYTTCTTAANSDCLTSVAGNTCNDLGGNGGTTYSCTCGAAYKNGTGGDGKPACVIGCSPTNHCRDNGDSTAACTDTSTGYSCTCDSGYIYNGTSCVSACPPTSPNPDPCGAGTCSSVSGGWTCACNTGYVSSGGNHPSCVNYNACIPTATSDCNTSFAGNTCVDQAPPSLTYACTCGNGAFVNGSGMDGNPACVAKNFCATNHCTDGGDSGATCSNLMLGTAGYACTCTSALWTTGLVAGNTSCVDKNECTSGMPCGNGTCTNVPAGGGYTCACNTGYVSTSGMTPTCIQPTCDATQTAACVTTQPGNTCVVNTPPATGYHCDCGNASYRASGTGLRCTPVGSCSPNHCVDDGDATATCTPRPAPDSGYDCTCDAGWAFDGTSCADVDECTLGGNPCGGGFCNNTPGGYTCNCPQGFASSGGKTPTCVSSFNTGNLQITTTPGSCAMAGDAPAPSALLLLPLVLLLLRRLRQHDHAIFPVDFAKSRADDQRAVAAAPAPREPSLAQRRQKRRVPR